MSDPLLASIDGPGVGPVSRPAFGAYGILSDVSVGVTVEVGRTTMKLRDILHLRPGEVIELGHPAHEPLDVTVDGRRVAGGAVVVVGEQFGLRLTDVAFS